MFSAKLTKKYNQRCRFGWKWVWRSEWRRNRRTWKWTVHGKWSIQINSGGDIAVIKTGDNYPYYLLKLLREPFETEATTSDDYNHEFPPFLRVIKSNYFELHKSTNDGDVYYIETKKKAIISTFCVVGNCPSPTAVTEKKRGKEQENNVSQWQWASSSFIWNSEFLWFVVKFKQVCLNNWFFIFGLLTFKLYNWWFYFLHLPVPL